jgi:hypothetical protein
VEAPERPGSLAVNDTVREAWVSDHDQLFKTLIRRFFDDLLRIVVPDIARELRLEDPEFLDGQLFTDLPEGEHRYLDLVAEVKTLDAETEIVLVHVEIEARARGRTMDHRMWHYAMQLWLRHERPVVPIVVYLKGGTPDVEPVTVEHRFAGQHLASYTYFAFGLARSQAARYLDRPELLAPALAALMDPRGLSPARHKIECLRRIARAEVDDAGRFLLVNCVETYVQWNDTAQEEYETLLAEEENQEVTTMEMTWGDRMMEKGRIEGLEKGRVEGMRTLVAGMIESRFGAVPADRKRRIEAIDSTDELTRLADRLLTARSLDDLGI